jgi:hypothetical protein
MTSPFRENLAPFTAFEKHVAIAQTLLGTVVSLDDRLATYDDVDVWQARGEGWSGLWEQLQQARALALELGRDVAGFDAVCARLENPYLVAARLGPILPAMRVAAVEAIDALRTAVPEVALAATSAPPARPAAARRSVWASPMFCFRIGLLVVVLLGGVIEWATR